MKNFTSHSTTTLHTQQGLEYQTTSAQMPLCLPSSNLYSPHFSKTKGIKSTQRMAVAEGQTQVPKSRLRLVVISRVPQDSRPNKVQLNGKRKYDPGGLLIHPSQDPARCEMLPIPVPRVYGVTALSSYLRLHVVKSSV